MQIGAQRAQSSSYPSITPSGTDACKMDIQNVRRSGGANSSTHTGVNIATKDWVRPTPRRAIIRLDTFGAYGRESAGAVVRGAKQTEQGYEVCICGRPTHQREQKVHEQVEAHRRADDVFNPAKREEEKCQ